MLRVSDRPTMSHAARVSLARVSLGSVVLLALTCAVSFADDQPVKPEPANSTRDEILADQRGQMMRRLVQNFRVESAEEGFPQRFEAKPLFRYTDAARGTVAGSVWRLGSTGRPKALLAMELNRSTLRQPSVLYEYGSLTTTPFTMTSSEFRWSPSRTLYEFKSLPNMPTPDRTASRRLIQMRAAASRFAGSEVQSGEPYQLRLLPQPVDRYRPTTSPQSDGAIFLFVFGTNPEAVLLLETDGTHWKYAIGRMTGAEQVTLTLDGQQVWEAVPLEPGQSAPYAYVDSLKEIEIPGFDKTGKEIAVPE